MKEYKHRTTFTYLGKRYVVRADSTEELYMKKALKLKELKDNIIIYDRNISVDEWAEQAFRTYKHGVKGLEDTKARYKKYVSPTSARSRSGTSRPLNARTYSMNAPE